MEHSKNKVVGGRVIKVTKQNFMYFIASNCYASLPSKGSGERNVKIKPDLLYTSLDVSTEPDP